MTIVWASSLPDHGAPERGGRARVAPCAIPDCPNLEECGLLDRVPGRQQGTLRSPSLSRPLRRAARRRVGRRDRGSDDRGGGRSLAQRRTPRRCCAGSRRARCRTGTDARTDTRGGGSPPSRHRRGGHDVDDDHEVSATPGPARRPAEPSAHAPPNDAAPGCSFGAVGERGPHPRQPSRRPLAGHERPTTTKPGTR